MKIEKSIIIKAPPRKVMDFFINLDKNYLIWHPKDHLKCEYRSKTPEILGSRIYFEERLGSYILKIDCIVTEYEPNRKLVVKEIFGTIKSSIEFKLGPTDNGTKVTQIIYAPIPTFLIRTLFKIEKVFSGEDKYQLLNKHIEEEMSNLEKILVKEQAIRRARI